MGDTEKYIINQAIKRNAHIYIQWPIIYCSRMPISIIIRYRPNSAGSLRPKIKNTSKHYINKFLDLTVCVCGDPKYATHFAP